MVKRSVRAVLFGIVGVCLLGLPSFAESLEVHIGFSSSVIASNFAPVRIDLSGFARPVEGILQITQQIGAPDAEPEDVVIEFHRGILENGTLTGSIPIFDPLNPIEVVAMDSNGIVLAARSINLRLFQRTARFPVVSGPPLDLGGLEVVVSPSELPADWWAYELVDSLWLNGGGISSVAWDAIARWVYAGGTLVVFAGEDYYQLESSAFRALFPLSEVRLETAPDGRQYLAGRATESIEVVLASEGAETPLLYQTAFGAGNVSVVAMQAIDVTQVELDAIRGEVPWAGWYSLLRFGNDFRGSMRVPRPIYMIAPSLVIVLLVCVGVLRWAFRRKARLPDSMATAFAVPAVAAVVVALAVWSGFYANNTKQLIELFQLNLSIQTHTSYGISLGFTGFVSPATTREATIEREQVSVPSYSLVKTTSETSFASSTDPEIFRFTINANEVRDFRTYGAPRRLLTFEFDETSFRASISNSLFTDLTTVYVLHEGRAHRLGVISSGDSVHQVGDGFPWRGFNTRSEHGDFLQAVVQEYRLATGTWLLAISDETRTVPGLQVPSEVRDVRLHIVEEGGR